MNNPKNPTLKRTLGLSSLIAICVGVVVGQGPLITILPGVGINPSGFLVAILIAFVLALGYVFTFTELALMMPKAGGISTYTEVAIGHLPAIVITITGYLGIAVFAGAADLFLLDYVMDALYPDTFGRFGLWVYIAIIVLNILGIEVFATVQNLLAFIMLAALVVIGIAGISSSETQDIPFNEMLAGFASLDWSILSLTVLAVWAFVGMEFVCPLVEETKQPERNLPRAMIISCFILLFVYGSIALAGYHKVPGNELVESSIPHWLLVKSIFGENARLLMAILAITAAATCFSTGIASISRMMYGMAKNNQLPSVFKLVHPKFKTPWFGIIFQCSLALAVYLIFQDSQNVVILLMISCSAIFLMIYIMAHVDLIILRKKYPDFPRPYRSPLFPIFQILGIIGMIYLLINNSPSPEMTRSVYLNAGLFTGVTTVFAVLWIKYRMKKPYFKGESIEKIL
ncbi:APC family permease [Fulvivirga sedimenti]|uniref:APC family permease n=1 Tax=Fulvivirga sedimenti TaxID=2879465 RepID=A0A9X1HP94_9BACT|nr:APC family permease [Fulvivirga sedimenti]MCA6073814.1 APC family permease [Fulvivirga sedimenti]